MADRKFLAIEQFRELVRGGRDGGGYRASSNMGVRSRAPASVTPTGVDGTLRFTISTGAVDRDRDTINPNGWDLDNYRRSPVVLWAHDYDEPPIGKATAIVATPTALIADVQFVPREIYEFADRVRRMCDGGYLNSTSVGFRPDEYVFNEERGGVDFLRQELLEFSIVPVPANPEALIHSRDGMDALAVKSWMTARAVFAGEGVEISEEQLTVLLRGVMLETFEELAKDAAHLAICRHTGRID